MGGEGLKNKPKSAERIHTGEEEGRDREEGRVNGVLGWGVLAFPSG